MADMNTVLERLVTDPDFRRQLREDPERALDGYDLDESEREMLTAQISEGDGEARGVEQRTSKSALGSVLAGVAEGGQAESDLAFISQPAEGSENPPSESTGFDSTGGEETELPTTFPGVDQSDPDRPVISGRLHNPDDPPPPDELDQAAVRPEDSQQEQGRYLEYKMEEALVTSVQASDQPETPAGLTLGQEEIEAKDGTITIKGKDITVKASGEGTQPDMAAETERAGGEVDASFDLKENVKVSPPDEEGAMVVEQPPEEPIFANSQFLAEQADKDDPPPDPPPSSPGPKPIPLPP